MDIVFKLLKIKSKKRGGDLNDEGGIGGSHW